MTIEKPLWETQPDGKIGPTAEGERVWAGGRPALDLAAIKADLAEVASVWAVLHNQTAMGEQSEILALVETGSSLVAEVERQALLLAEIRAMHHEKHGTYTHVDPGTGDHLGDEPYVICDYDKTPWPCRTQLVLDGKSSDSSSTGGEL